MMGELALRYPRDSLAVSTGAYENSAASDARFPQPIDRVPIRATRLRTVQGLALWTWRAAALARRLQPGFVWCAELKPAAYPARWIAARQRVPFGVFVHGSTELTLLRTKSRGSRVRRRIAQALLKRAAVVVANSRFTAALARDVLEEHDLAALAREISVVPLGADPRHFRPAVDPAPLRARLALPAGEWILTVARLQRAKGIDTVIQCLPALRRSVPDLQYVIAGAGPHRAEFEQLAAGLGVRDAVHFVGPVSLDDLPALYNAATLYVGPSRPAGDLTEGFGLSFVEAAACGLAVVAGRVGGVPEAVRDGTTGILVESEDSGAVAGAIAALLANPELRRQYGAAGRHAVETYFNWDRVARDLQEIDGRYRR